MRIPLSLRKYHPNQPTTRTGDGDDYARDRERTRQRALEQQQQQQRRKTDQNGGEFEQGGLLQPLRQQQPPPQPQSSSPTLDVLADEYDDAADAVGVMQGVHRDSHHQQNIAQDAVTGLQTTGSSSIDGEVAAEEGVTTGSLPA